MTSPKRNRLAIDIGGTFTDLALHVGGELITAKTLTTYPDPELGVMRGVDQVLGAAGASADALDLVIHGTTLATNALIERRGATTALLTTAGHRDALEMAYENRFEQYDINIDRPEPLVPRYLRFGVNERLDVAGRVLVPLDEAAVEALLPQLDALN
ncbi:MAG: hydantoinase/oxoprolinase family protein, partial [Gammaproteobacteria bacterium]|nr:hydantoinase/oxoprolinase family protein [Gammaproteobacteria bacterium]